MSNSQDFAGNHAMNATQNDYQFFTSIYALLPLCIVILFGLITNGIVVIATLTEKKLCLLGNSLHVCLASADILSLLNYALLIVNQFTDDTSLRNRISAYVCCVLYFIFYWSLLTVVGICCIRLVKFRRPLFAGTRRLTVLIVMLSPAISCLLGLLRSLSEPMSPFVALCGGGEVVFTNTIPYDIVRAINYAVLCMAILVIFGTYTLCIYYLSKTKRVKIIRFERRASMSFSSVAHYDVGTGNIALVRQKARFSIMDASHESNAFASRHTRSQGSGQPLAPLTKMTELKWHKIRSRSPQDRVYRDRVVNSVLVLTLWIFTVFIPIIIMYITRQNWAMFLTTLFYSLKPVIYFVRQSYFRQLIVRCWSQNKHE